MEQFFDHTACYLERLNVLDTVYAEAVLQAAFLTYKYDSALFDSIGPALDRLKVKEPSSGIEDVVAALISVVEGLTAMGASFKSLKGLEDISEIQVRGFWARIRYVFKHRKSVTTWLKTGEYY